MSLYQRSMFFFCASWSISHQFHLCDYVSRVDLMQLIEEAVDGCWIGHRARTAMGDSGIGSVYAPPSENHGSAFTTRRKHVETVVDIEYRPEVKFVLSYLKDTDSSCLQGWSLKCEKGGIRRVLMNLFGNSLKFTSV